jgi:hypothetical protein
MRAIELMHLSFDLKIKIVDIIFNCKKFWKFNYYYYTIAQQGIILAIMSSRLKRKNHVENQQLKVQFLIA